MEYPLQPQEMGLWCWAAVALSVERYFNEHTHWTQCKIASVRKRKKCCNDKPACNEADELDLALEAVSRFRSLLSGPLSFSAIKDQIRAGYPVCARIGWFGGGGHFVVVTGYTVTESGEQLVAIGDPLYESGIWQYDEFSSAYFGAGQWTHTYLVHE